MSGIGEGQIKVPCPYCKELIGYEFDFVALPALERVREDAERENSSQPYLPSHPTEDKRRQDSTRDHPRS